MDLGTRLVYQQAYLVPATHVFFRSHNQEQETESERGIASGMVWEEAICQALLDWCNYLTVGQLKDAQQAYLQVDLVRGSHDSRRDTSAIVFSKQPSGRSTVYDVTGALQVPTFAMCLGENVMAYSTHCDGAQALSIGLEQALQQYQSEQFQQLDYAVDPVPDLPLSLRSDQLSVPRYTLPEAWSARRGLVATEIPVRSFMCIRYSSGP